MKDFKDFLAEQVQDQRLANILESLLTAGKEFCAIFQRTGDDRILGYIDGKNSTGDEQAAMDIVANEIFVKHCRENEYVTLIGSEEEPEPIPHDDEGYAVMFDPLDGSSIVDVNMSVGTIIGIYEGRDILGKTGRDQVVSLILIYGRELSLFITVGQGVHEFIYEPKQQKFIWQAENVQLHTKGKFFGPGGIHTIGTEKWYGQAILALAEQGYSVRYSGSMVPDIAQILVKGGGMYMYPSSQKNPEGKLRLLYECAPMAWLIEEAGGAAHSGEQAILDIPIQAYHQRTGIFIGSQQEVAFMQDRFVKKSTAFD